MDPNICPSRCQDPDRHREAVPEGIEVINVDDLPDRPASFYKYDTWYPFIKQEDAFGPNGRVRPNPNRTRAPLPTNAIIIDLDAEPASSVDPANVYFERSRVKQEDDEDDKNGELQAQRPMNNDSQPEYQTNIAAESHEVAAPLNEAEPLAKGERNGLKRDASLQHDIVGSPPRCSDAQSGPQTTQGQRAPVHLSAPTTGESSVANAVPDNVEPSHVTIEGSSGKTIVPQNTETALQSSEESLKQSCTNGKPTSSPAQSAVIDPTAPTLISSYLSNSSRSATTSGPKAPRLVNNRLREQIRRAQQSIKARVGSARSVQHDASVATRKETSASPGAGLFVDLVSNDSRPESSAIAKDEQIIVARPSSGIGINDGDSVVVEAPEHQTCDDDDLDEQEDADSENFNQDAKQAIRQDNMDWRAAKSAYKKVEKERKRKRHVAPTLEEEVQWERITATYRSLMNRRQYNRKADHSENEDQRRADGWKGESTKHLKMSRFHNAPNVPPYPDTGAASINNAGIDDDDDEVTHFEIMNVLTGEHAPAGVSRGSHREKHERNTCSRKSKKATKTNDAAHRADSKAKVQKNGKKTNVVRDAMGNTDALPAFETARRNKALKALIASLPAELRDDADTDKKHLLAAFKDFTCTRSIRTISGGQTASYGIPGMASTLRPHQLLGAAFMRRRENDVLKPYGGICADQMGLGKTVMMLANIVDDMKKLKQMPKNAEFLRTTLIVATNALVEQWKGEIVKHCGAGKTGLKVIVYKAGSRMDTSDDVEALLGFDIVLTTYDEVRRSYPKSDYPIDLQTAEEKAEWWRKYFHENRGILHKVEFLRVVLDEAQAIKNFRSHTSIACSGLLSKYRWALSGTPIQNSVQELYPYFKFLKVQYTGTYKVFCTNFISTGGRANAEGGERLQQLLRRIMIRRTHQSRYMGMPLVVLPRASQQIRWCKFNDLERSIYDIVHSRMIKRINRLSRCGQLEQNYSHILTMLLRLRQLTGHLLTLQRPMRDLLEREDLEKIHDLAKIEGDQQKLAIRQLQIRRIRTLLAKGAKDERLVQTKIPGVNEDDESHRPSTEHVADPDNIGLRHGLQYDFLKYLQTLRGGNQMTELIERTTCVFCADTAEQPMITSCYHIYCKPCLETAQAEAVVQGIESRCKQCGVLYNTAKECDRFDLTNLKDYHRSGDIPSDTDDEMLRRETRLDRKKCRQMKKRKDDWIDQEGINILPSAKTIEIKAQILNWVSEDPKVKIIIFTQFVDMIRILSKVCEAERWRHTTYYGGKSMEQRLRSIKEFTEIQDIRILLASLKTGGIGLNLTMASKVIIVDPWWNSSVEQQAFCRVFRIGQNLETSLTRFVVENTVDQKMVEMQERKQAEIDQVIDGKTVQLGTSELLHLFGGVRTDDDGQPFIYAEDQEDHFVNPLADDDEGWDDEF